MDLRTGKLGVPLSYVIRPANADPTEAPDEYILRAIRAASFQTQQPVRRRQPQSLRFFKDLLTKTEGATWFEKVRNGDGSAAHLLLQEHYVGEAHDMRRAGAAHAKLETLFWKSEASFLFEEYLTRLNEAFKELEDAGQALWETQKVTHLLKGLQNDDIQVLTMIGIVRNSFLLDLDAARLTLPRTVSCCFASIESNRQKSCIGAIDTRGGGIRGGRGACGRGRHTGGRGGGRGTNRPMRVTEST